MKAKHYDLNVTRGIIDRAKPGDSHNCFVAEAIRQQIPGAESVDVTGEYAKFNLFDESGNGTRFLYNMREWCCRFDSGTRICPSPTAW
jgi:hypothetical protein